MKADRNPTKPNARGKSKTQKASLTHKVAAPKPHKKRIEHKQAEKDLLASQPIIEGIINAIPVRVFWKDKNLVYLGCNAVFARDKGFADPKDVIGKDDYQMARRDQAELYRGDDRQVIESGHSKLLVEEPQTTPEGNIITLLTSKVPLRSSTGEIIGVLGTYMDITERKRAETALHSAEENYRSIFEQAPVGIFQSTPQGRFRNVNSAMAQIYGYDSPKQMITEITSIGDQVYVNSSTRQEFQRILAEHGEIHNSLDENYRKDGSHIWTQTTARAVKDKDGNILFYEGFIIDVTERLQEQQQLHESEERFRALIENASDMILTITANGNLNYVSPAALRITGYQANEVIGRNIVEFIHADDLPLALQALASRSKISGLAPDPIELRFHHKDGMWRIVEILGNNLLEYPAVKGIVLNVRDITERKQAEAALRESEDRNRDLVENSQDLICTHDLNGQILSFNPSAEKMLGYPVETLKQMNIRDIIVPSARPVFETYIAILKRRGKAHGIMHIQTGNGEQRFWEYNNTLRTEGVTTPIVRGMARDITERKRAEDALRENEKTIRSLFENMLNGFAYCQMLFEQERPSDFIYLEVNKAFETLTGLKNVVGKKVSEVIPGICESDPELIATYGRVALTGIAETFETYVEALRMWFSITVYSPKKEYFVAVFDVITERKRVEEALHAAKNLLEKTFVSLDEAVLISDPNTRMIITCNPAVGRIFGYAENDVIGRTTEFMHVDRSWFDRFGDELFPALDADGMFHTEFQMRRKDGSVFPTENTVTEIKDDLGRRTSVVSVIRDITDRKRAEQVVRDSEKRFRALIENSADAITLIDTNGIAIYDSAAAPGMLGYAPEDWIGRDVFALVHPDDLPKSRDLFQRLGETPGARVNYILRVRHKSGSWLWIEMVATNLLAEPSVKAIVLNYRDITERKQAEEALHQAEIRYRELVEQTPAVIYTVDSRQPDFFVHISQQIEALSGYSPQAWIADAQLWIELIHSEDRARVLAEEIRTNKTGEQFKIEYRLVHRDGHLVWVHEEARQLHDASGQPTVWQGFMLNITERKQAEEEIKSQLEELQRWQDVMLGRGEREQKLKREVNELCRRVGESARYPSQEIGAADSEPAPAKS